jgi:hypothetical protein
MKAALLALALVFVLAAPALGADIDGPHYSAGLGYYSDSLVIQGESEWFDFAQTASDSYYAMDDLTHYKLGQLKIEGAFICKFANDNVKYWTAIIVMFVDWGQTRYGIQYPGNYQELNPLLGANPSNKEVDTYFASLMFLYSISRYAFAPKLFNKISWLIIATESYCIMHNFSLGIKVKF